MTKRYMGAVYSRRYYEKHKEELKYKSSLYRPIYAERQRQFKKLSTLEKQQYFAEKYGKQKA